MASFDGLDRMKALLKALGNPEEGFRVLHVAGTNGKGSTSVMMAAVLEKAGYRVGLYTSPHLEDESERVQIWDGDHRMIDGGRFCELKALAEEKAAEAEVASFGRATVFEIYTAAAYLWFAEQKPDYVVLETGLGGRLDSTNTIDKPLVSVITRVGLDHTAQLGNTIFRIAREKAGIIKPGIPVVSQNADLTVKNIISRTAREKGCVFIDVSEKIGEGSVRIPELAMKGGHQRLNAATALLAVRAAGIEVTDSAAEAGLSEAYLPGRFEIIETAESDGQSQSRNRPVFIIDGAHNPDAVEALVIAFNDYTRTNNIKRTLVIFGCMKDKNYTRMLQLLLGGLKGCSYAATAVDYERAESPERIAELIAASGRGCHVFDTSREAYEYAEDSGFECVLVCGSIYLAGEMRRHVLNN